MLKEIHEWIKDLTGKVKKGLREIKEKVLIWGKGSFQDIKNIIHECKK